ncbi:GNAT family N-acetyltransferase [Catelliglobosispora koreensis]|uniref:GNAT family N-acetyltransferase n=1 Tax=Catelliglobosispora koreensis TaxID=129052 RepID=UPI00036208A1|nr:GNAT family N-acetyltransferase [Catelliglobosispora koreensis]
MRSQRAARLDDASAIHQLMGASSRDLDGMVEVTLERVISDLQRPAIQLDKDTLLVHDHDGRLIARAWVHRGRRAEVTVHPANRGQGLGSDLLAWVEKRAVDVGSERLGQTISDADHGAAALLSSRGYEPKATQWRLEITSSEPPTLPALDAITVRSFQVGDEYAVYEMVEEAFSDWQQRRRDFEEWSHETIRRPDFAPALSPLAFREGQLVGAVLSLDDPAQPEGYIERVAVHRDHRRQGIAQLLLRQAFRSYYEAGKQTCYLYTHSETGAVALYEHVGMTVRTTATHFSKALRFE